MRYLFLLFLFSTSSFAQQLDNIGKGKPFTLSGGVGGSSAYRYISEGRNSPLSFFLNGNLNASVYGWSVPISINYSNGNNFNYTQPFNQYGLSPTYKKATLHLGWRSMSFSPYSMSGRTFYGAGSDFEVKGIKVSTFTGRLTKAVFSDSIQTIPVYERWGGGVKLTMPIKNFNLEYSIFKAKDLVSSVVSDSVIKPQENLVHTIGVSGSIAKFTVNGSIAQSCMTHNILIDEPASDNYFYNRLFFKPNSSTSNNKAVKIDLGYSFLKHSIQLGYERIDPDYETMGSYFFNNDFQNITVSESTKLLKDKLQLNLQFGKQINNLNHQKASSQSRFIRSGSVQYQISKSAQASFNYSNFLSFTRRSALLNELQLVSDTLFLNFVQITSSASGQFSKRSNKNKNSIFSITGSFQNSSDVQEKDTVKQKNRIYFVSVNQNFKIAEKGPSFSFAWNVNFLDNENKNLYMGPSLSINKAFSKLLRVGTSSSFNYSKMKGMGAVKQLVQRVSLHYTVNKKCTFNVAAFSSYRFSDSSNLFSFNLNSGFNYNF